MSLAGASLFSFVALSSMLTGCSEREAPATMPATEVRTDTYTDILGIIVQLPVEGKPGSEFKIHHEHIPDFKTKTGDVFVTADGIPGMKAMQMPFPVKEPVSIEGFELGDKVRFSFAVNYGGIRAAWHITAIEKIEPSTEISFANKVVETDDHAGHDHGDLHDHDDHAGHDHDHDEP